MQTRSQSRAGAPPKRESTSLTDQHKPTTPRKRPRFSAPAILTTTLAGDSIPSPTLANQTTGLTPSLRRTRLCPPTPTGRRRGRHSFPACSLVLQQAHRDLPDLSEEQSITITPLRQALSDRTRRRLRRSHLSEELNAHAADQAAVQRLRRDAAARDKTIAELELELELANQRSLGVLVDERRESATQTSVYFAGLSDSTLLRDRGLASALGLRSVSSRGLASEPAASGFACTPSAERTTSDFASVTEAATPTPTFPLSPATTEPATPVKSSRRTSLASPTQVLDVVEPDADSYRRIVASLEDAVGSLTRDATDARAALERVASAVAALGFDAAAADFGDLLPCVAARDATVQVLDSQSPASPSPTEQDPPSTEDHIATHLELIQQTFRAARLALEHLIPGETVGSFSAARLLRVLLTHVRRLATELHAAQDEAQAAHIDAGAAQAESGVARTAERNMRRQFDGLLARASHAEARLTIVLAQREKLREAVEGRGEELGVLEERVREQRRGIVRLRDENEELRDEALGLKNEAQVLRDEAQELKEEASRLEGEREREKEDREMLEAEVSASHAREATLETSVAAHETEQARLVEELRLAEVSRQRLKEMTRRYADEVRGLEELVGEMERQAASTIGALNRRVGDLEGARDRVVKELRVVRSERDGVVKERDQLRCERDVAVGERDGVREEKEVLAQMLGGVVSGLDGKVKDLGAWSEGVVGRVKRDSGVAFDGDQMEG